MTKQKKDMLWKVVFSAIGIVFAAGIAYGTIYQNKQNIKANTSGLGHIKETVIKTDAKVDILLEMAKKHW